MVAVQSLAVLSTLVAKGWREPGRGELELFALSMWLWGVMFYIWIIALLFFRYTYFAYASSDVDAPSWINMGAMAISALAGAELARNAGDASFVASLLPFLKGFTVFCWAAGTWWIPMLLVLTAWRQFVERTPPHYNPAGWAAVFPLGMYAEATRQMAAAFDLRFLDFPAWIMFVIAATAWALAFAGLLWDLGHALIRSEAKSS